MVVIHLYGVLEQVAQRVVRLNTTSFDESMRALTANFPNIVRTLRDMRVSVLVNGEMMTFEDCLRPMDAERIDIMPVVGGNGPAIFILAGSAMVAGSATIANLFVGSFLASAITAASVASFGMSLIIGGISQLLIKPPKSSMGNSAQDNASYNFNGAVNVTQQGNVVPVGYGRMKVGSLVVSANVQTWDLPLAPVTPPSVPAAPPANPTGPFDVDYGSPGPGVGAI